FDLLQPEVTVSRVLHLQFFRAAGGTSLDEASKTGRFAGKTQFVQCPYRKHRIPYPAVAVVPVTLVTDPFRKGGGRGGDHGTGWVIDQTLQDSGRPPGGNIVGAFRFKMTEPILPPGMTHFEFLVELIRLRQGFGLAIAQPLRQVELNGQVVPVPRMGVETSMEVAVVPQCQWLLK